MTLNHEVRIPVLSTLLALGTLANVLLILCLAHTWKYWRQVKWYVVFLTVGNALHVGVTQFLTLKAELSTTGYFPASSTALCRFSVFSITVGPSLSAMAIAALSLHVLLTTMSGSQGNRLRHALVIGLFVLLGLVLPLAKIPFFKRMTYNFYDQEHSTCMMSLDSAEAHLQFQVGESVAVAFFPLFVTVCCVLTAAILLNSSSQGNMKGDEDKSDVILAGLFGAVLLVFSVPYHISTIVTAAKPQLSADSWEIVFNLRFLLDCFCIASPIVIIVFAYLHAYRSRGEFFVIPGAGKPGNGERQKLVN